MNCVKCKTRIVTHEWLVNGYSFCSPSCQRGKGPDLFEKLWDRKRNEWKFDNGRTKPRAPEAQ